MLNNKIYCFGDGFATGHIWPEWPQILQALLPEYTIINISGIGAGPEWLVTRLVQIGDNIKNSTVVWQWPLPNRFDKLVTNNDWAEIIASDPVYNFNTYINNGQTWWLSSASKIPVIQEYHTKFINTEQHTQRLDNYQFLVEHALKNLECQYVSLMWQDAEDYSCLPRFAATRQQQFQPSPVVHFYYCVEKLLPALNLTSQHTEQLEFLINQQSWIPYDPDRNEIWATIKEKLIVTNDKY
jgi:hypothetical protein